MSSRLEGTVCVITGTSHGPRVRSRLSREGASVVGCDLNVDATETTVELVPGSGGDMISTDRRHLTDPAD